MMVIIPPVVKQESLPTSNVSAADMIASLQKSKPYACWDLEPESAASIWVGSLD